MSENRLVYYYMGKLYTNLFYDCISLTHFFTSEVKKIKIDHEYSCVWAEEFSFLTKHGIRYAFAKTIDGVSVWKFKKTEELFRTLAAFYSNVYSK